MFRALCVFSGNILLTSNVDQLVKAIAEQISSVGWPAAGEKKQNPVSIEINESRSASGASLVIHKS